VRLVLVTMLLLAGGARAEACPRGQFCVVAETRMEIVAMAEIAREAPAAAPTIDLAIRSDVPAVDMLARSLRTHVAPSVHGVEMPWIWRVLRQNVYARMPRYERIESPDQRFTLVLSPVVVTSSLDTVPGVGIEGGF
jgi:hypothetical protein